MVDNRIQCIPLVRVPEGYYSKQTLQLLRAKTMLTNGKLTGVHDLLFTISAESFTLIKKANQEKGNNLQKLTESSQQYHYSNK
jgi:hypothetical protein